MNDVTSFSTTMKVPLRLPRNEVLRGRTLVRLVILLSIVVTACHAPHRTLVKSYRQFNSAEQAIADSLLATALDHEALLTLYDTLKPMSSVKLYRLPLFSTNAAQSDSAVKAMQQLQRIVNRLSFGDWEFILNPFERIDSIYKNVEVYVFRKSRLQSMIRTQSAFYHQLGVTEFSLPATVLAITEYENKYDRWRSYGYLFGYPAHAVDFFVNAGKQQDSTGQFVKRDFFQIPVYTGNSGYFAYAIPKGHKTGEADSLIYFNTERTLKRYREERNDNRRSSSVKLWMRMNKK